MVLVLASQMKQQPRRGSFPRPINIQAVTAHVLSRETGETVLTQEGVDTGSWIGWVGETQPFRMQVRYGSLTLSLKCLDTPAVGEPPVEMPK